MEDRLHQLEQRVESLTHAVEQLQARLDAQLPAQPWLSPVSAQAPGPTLIAAEKTTSAVPLVGRSLLVLAGAFVFRLLTEQELLSRGLGLALAFVFAVLWVVVAEREARKSRRLSALFHAGTACLIGFSLLLESASKQAPFPVFVGPLALASFTALVLWLAWRHRLEGVAFAAELGCLVTLGFWLRRGDVLVPSAWALWSLAAASLVLAERRSWPQIRWPVALFLDVALLRLVFGLTAPSPGQMSPGPQLGALMLVVQASVALYLGAAVWGAWRRLRPVRAFEAVQTVLVLGVGWKAMTQAQLNPGLWGLAIAALSLATAFHLASRKDWLFDSWFFGLLSVMLVPLASRWVLGGEVLGLSWAAVAVALAVVGRFRLSALFWGAAAVLGWLALIPGDAAGFLLNGLARSPDALWSDLRAAVVVTGGLSWLSWAAMAWGHQARQAPLLRTLALAPLTLGILSLVAFANYGIHSWFGASGALTAAVLLGRTLLLCVAAVALAALARWGAPPETRWASWGVLLLCAIKVLAQDLSLGQAATSVVALLALGLAILAIPRLLKPLNSATA